MEFTGLNRGDVWWWLREKNITQIDFAKIAGLNPTYISEILNGRRNPTTQQLEAMNEALAAIERGGGLS